jgi:hypothetical protein
MWPYAWPVPGKNGPGTHLCNASRGRFRGRFRRRSGLRLWLGFRLGQRSRPGPGFWGWFRRYGLRLWLGFRRGHRPRPGFRRLRPWSGRRPRRRLRVRRLRHGRPLRSRDRRRLHRFGARRFRQYRLRLAGIAGYFARVHRVSAGVICCHPGIVPGPAPATRAAAASGQVACTRVRGVRFCARRQHGRRRRSARHRPPGPPGWWPRIEPGRARRADRLGRMLHIETGHCEEQKREERGYVRQELRYRSPRGARDRDVGAAVACRDLRL